MTGVCAGGQRPTAAGPLTCHTNGTCRHVWSLEQAGRVWSVVVQAGAWQDRPLCVVGPSVVVVVACAGGCVVGPSVVEQAGASSRRAPSVVKQACVVGPSVVKQAGAS